jgi:hypothetical protein
LAKGEKPSRQEILGSVAATKILLMRYQLGVPDHNQKVFEEWASLQMTEDKLAAIFTNSLWRI